MSDSDSPIPAGYCQCGCGRRTNIAQQNRPDYGHVKGQPFRYVRGHMGKYPGLGYEVDPSRGCWIWTRHLNNKGYPVLRRGHLGVTLAHRHFYELAHGPIPEGMTLDHLCREPRCVNPAHMEPVTLIENIRRAWAHRTETREARTTCLHGHPWTPENTFVRYDGYSECRICSAAH